MLPEKLKALLEEATDDLSVSLVDTTIEVDQVALTIHCQHLESRQTWHMVALKPLDFEFVSGFVDDLRMYDDHPRLWAFTDEQSSLYFNGLAADTNSLALNLTRTHYQLTGEMIPVTAYMKCRSGDVQELCSKGFGLFAEGPLSLLKRYSDCLEQAGVKCSFVGTRKAMVWTENGWQELATRPLLLEVGANWIIGQSFSWHLVG